jgi:hypothetical protein
VRVADGTTLRDLLVRLVRQRRAIRRAISPPFGRRRTAIAEVYDQLVTKESEDDNVAPTAVNPLHSDELYLLSLACCHRN